MTARKPAGEPLHSAQEVMGEPFALGDYVVYAGHGVGRVKAFEAVNVAGQALTLLVIAFDQNGMVLRVPFQKIRGGGLRAIASSATMRDALSQLARPVPTKAVIWNRRMVEYMAKINSGDLFAVAEVVRDLHRISPGKPRSPAAQEMYERAFVRLSDELAAVDKTDSAAAAAKLDLLLNAA